MNTNAQIKYSSLYKPRHTPQATNYHLPVFSFQKGRHNGAAAWKSGLHNRSQHTNEHNEIKKRWNCVASCTLVSLAVSHAAIFKTSTFDAQGDHTFPRKLPHVTYFVPQKLIASKFISTRRPDQFVRLHMMSLPKPSSNSVWRQGPIKLLKSRLNKQRNWLYGWLNWFYIKQKPSWRRWWFWKAKEWTQKQLPRQNKVKRPSSSLHVH